MLKLKLLKTNRFWKFGWISARSLKISSAIQVGLAKSVGNKATAIKSHNSYCSYLNQHLKLLAAFRLSCFPAKSYAWQTF